MICYFYLLKGCEDTRFSRKTSDTQGHSHDEEQESKATCDFITAKQKYVSKRMVKVNLSNCRIPDHSKLYCLKEPGYMAMQFVQSFSFSCFKMRNRNTAFLCSYFVCGSLAMGTCHKLHIRIITVDLKGKSRSCKQVIVTGLSGV